MLSQHALTARSRSMCSTDTMTGGLRLEQAAFLGLEAPDEVVARVIEHASFGSMKLAAADFSAAGGNARPLTKTLSFC